MIASRRSLSLFAAVFLTLASPAFAGPGDKALDDVRILSADDMQGRGVATPGSEKSRAYILSRFAEIGLAPVGDRFEHGFSFSKRDGSTVQGVNLIARIKGTKPGKVMVVTAHYDHLGVRNGEIYNGADDNASGVAGLLAVAEAFKAKRPKHDVLFAVVDAEESGLRGARAFMAAPPVPRESIALNINFDMLSKNTKNELFVAGASPFPVLRPILERVAATAPVALKLGHDTDADGPQNNWTTQSDHYAFGEKGVPWVYFGVEDHPEYHRPSDDFATIPQDFFKRSVTTVVQASRALDASLDDVAKSAGR
ncbi:M20/M25/M40 family metallo-hydrolase [Caulobacter vibrioides]|uniref:M20/M25/M40 family metallo-hydrolase n=1 Tax=Caulobacter vibrioides TaxID=155892 RepID=UPI000BB49381|nr:M20/M25/M40 family metallo-hydrolase [Caulobacter vibrioides]ATC25490.1 peptidase M20 [Caulobacter vibrioides]AZH13585.1 M20/M25/M40 family metallo-hydrolase [Caulobacter vibrioides]PLR14450.1 peptidase M20 [Caulobacter vibrioides]